MITATASTAPKKFKTTLALAVCEVRPTDIRGMDCEDG
ncbi:hypothetical protein Y59_29400 [Enterobacter hormaechei]|nr:hypothetical protein Y59_29400 [Enterobacter hormaechei]